MQGGITLNFFCLWRCRTNLESKLNHRLDYLAVPPIKHQALSSAIVDTGVTGHYLVPSARQYCTDIQPTLTGPSAQVANGSPLSTKLSQEAQDRHIFDNINSGSLISIGQLCDDDCVSIFTKYHVDITKDGQIIIGGHRNTSNGLWNITIVPKYRLISYHQPLPTRKPQHHLVNGAIRHAKTKNELTDFLHGCAFSPLPSTFVCAIKIGYFSYWPGLTETLIPNSLSTRKCHLRMQQRNLNSTKPHTSVPIATYLAVQPSHEPMNAATNKLFALLLPTSDIHKSYLDLTGKFPV